MKDYDPIFDEFPEDDPLIATSCDCAEWKRLNEACADLMLERDTLRELIEVHNNACSAYCARMEASNGCSDYTSRGRTCPDCPMEWIIDLPEN